jgi:Mrp family chromosome partitioning ATPase
VKTISVLSRKGGTGKTTLAVNLAITAFLDGHRVMLADLDPQRSASDALRTRKCPGPAFTDSCAGKLFHVQSNAKRDGVELLIVDTPAAPEMDVAHAVNLSDLCLVVGRPSFLDLAPIVRSADTVRRLNRQGLIVLNQAHTNRPEVAACRLPGRGRSLALLRPAPGSRRIAIQKRVPTGHRSRPVGGRARARRSRGPGHVTPLGAPEIRMGAWASIARTAPELAARAG